MLSYFPPWPKRYHRKSRVGERDEKLVYNVWASAKWLRSMLGSPPSIPVFQQEL
jgi:hypothetical protein